MTVVVPTLVTSHPWQEPLHNQLKYALAVSMLGRPDGGRYLCFDVGGRLSGRVRLRRAGSP